MQPSQTLAQFLQGADTVIRGTVTQVQTVRLGEKVSETLKGGAYEQISVRVDEVMSGIAPDSVQVRRLMSTEELEVDVDSYRRPVEVGATYVMALFRGSGMWAGSYLFQGPQAAAPVVKGVVRFPTGAIPLPAGDNNLISKASVLKLLQDAGVGLRRQGMNDEQTAQAVRLYESGLSLARVGEQVGFEPSQCR